MSLWDNRHAANAKRIAQLNKNSLKLVLKNGDIVIDKKQERMNKKYTLDGRDYYVVLFVKNPTCPECVGRIVPRHLCCNKPTVAVKLQNLHTGRITSRNISNLTPLPTGQLMDPQFLLTLPQLGAFNRHSLADLGNLYNQGEEPEEHRYNLRSSNVVGDLH